MAAIRSSGKAGAVCCFPKPVRWGSEAENKTKSLVQNVRSYFHAPTASVVGLATGESKFSTNSWRHIARCLNPEQVLAVDA